jgi:hypothetical protein
MTDPPRLGRFETLGAWLRVWTPPRGADVPPIPWRKVAIGGAACAAAAAAIYVLVSPGVESGKRGRAVNERRTAERLAFSERRRIRQEQRLMTGRLPGDPSRDALVAALERSITADARRRAAAGELRGSVIGTDCAASRPGSGRSARVGYRCTALTGRVQDAGGRAASIGYPFWANVDRRSGSYAWCRVVLPPGEGSAGNSLGAVRVPRACDVTSRQ